MYIISSQFSLMQQLYDNVYNDQIDDGDNAGDNYFCKKEQKRVKDVKTQQNTKKIMDSIINNMQAIRRQKEL